MKYNYFYKITNIVNNKFYYGVHKTNILYDNYMGSGKILGLAKKKYGEEYFDKDILKFFSTYEECLAYEALIVDETMVKNPMCYNIRVGGSGGSLKGINLGSKRSEETKQKMRDKKIGYKPWNTGKTGVQKSTKKGKTNEELYGKDRAALISNKQSLSAFNRHSLTN